LLAKQPGITSFSALWQIKDALKTKKTGHTGTLDTFADGLLVALTGRYTRLVPFITDCDKEYIAFVAFGSETDTLDPEGTVTKTGPLPDLPSVTGALNAFRGEIEQTPPLYSAVHVDGKRASDRTRGGETVALEPRKIVIHSIEIESTVTVRDNERELIQGAVLRVVCSKGTYIRSLARDIAAACGTYAHLAALRRTRIGPFPLEKAAGAAMLPPFSPEIRYQFGKGERPPRAEASDIRSSLIPFTRDISAIIGLPPLELVPDKREAFLRGMKMDTSWFLAAPCNRQAVFCGPEFMGAIVASEDRLTYGFVFGGPP